MNSCSVNRAEVTTRDNMTTIHLTHESHGNKIAYCEPEAVNDEKNGWIRIDLSSKQAPEESDESLAKRYEIKFGKKPHHRMSQSTITEALKE